VAAALIRELNALWEAFPAQKALYLEEYRRRCATTGREVQLIRSGETRLAYAEAINDDFTLRVRLPDGTHEDVFSGEASVRGLEGYA